ncbi:MAG: hypothetical protein ACTSR8_08705 [Promethearchaeota archaeon]
MAFDLIFIINLLCSIGGILFFLYSLFIIQKIRVLFPGARILKKWTLIQALIMIFLFGYVFNIVFLALNLQELLLYMTPIVYLFGGLFVFIIISLSHKTYKLIILQNQSK